jgi:hypothetical protein
MREVPLTRGMVALVDDEDYERVAGFGWFALTNGRVTYAARKHAGSTVYMHLDVVGASDSRQVDHRDGNGLNNRRSNLRWATRAEQGRNRPCYRNNAAGLKGVQRVQESNRWRARITFEGRTHNLGCFGSPEDAAHAYDDKAREVFGDFARLNFPTPGNA